MISIGANESPQHSCTEESVADADIHAADNSNVPTDPTEAFPAQESNNEGDIREENLAVHTNRAENTIVTSLTYKSRKRGKEGPNACLVTSGPSAINKAIESATNREGDPIFYPYLGTVFCSYEEAKEFYNLYSWEIGFGIRESRSKKNGNEYITRKDIVCSCEGFCKDPRSASARCGCKAMLRLHRTDNHGWVVTKLVTEHTHKLSATCGEKKQWPSHGYIDPMTKEFVKRLRRNNVALGRVCSIVGVLSPDHVVPIRKQRVKRLCAKIAQEDIQDDMKKTLELLAAMKSSDPAMEVRFKTDGDGRIEIMIWCTGKNKLDYKKFGDVITFDTTYRTNLYNLPFGIFVGVNNHYQTIIFGGVLLNHERTEDFEWAFGNFIEIMGGDKPQTMLTDQCQAMASAIKTTLQGTRHRWCRWHVLRKAKQKLGTAYSKRSTFKKKFNDLITYEISPSLFEERWKELVTEYKLEKNSFMTRAYKMRGMWAKPYFMNIFCAGMTSTQRSESANHMLKRFIQRAAPMHIFVSKFSEFQFDRNQEEQREIHLTKQMTRKKRIGVPIERHAETIYTREMHERFYNELYKSGAYTIVDRSSNGQRFTVVHSMEVGGPQEHRYDVMLVGTNKIVCTCGLYEHVGLPCRHSLKILVHLDKTEIPIENICLRWSKDADHVVDQPSQDSVLQEVIRQNNEMKKRVLVMKALELSQSHGQIDDEAYSTALQAMDSILPCKRDCMQEFKAPEEHVYNGVATSSTAIPISCPPRPKRNCRPRDNSLKSWKKHYQNDKRKSSTETTKTDSDDETDDLMPSKTRKICDLLHLS